MKINYKHKAIALSAVLLTTSFFQTGCFGSFKLTHKVYEYNGAMGNKFFRTGTMYLFAVLWVYVIALTIDVAIYNAIEFWTGENPLTMGPLEHQTQIMAINGQSLRVTVTQNRYHIENMKKHEVIDIAYTPASQSWKVFRNGKQL